MSILRRPGVLRALWLAVVVALAVWLAATRWNDMCARRPAHAPAAALLRRHRCLLRLCLVVIRRRGRRVRPLLQLR